MIYAVTTFIGCKKSNSDQATGQVDTFPDFTVTNTWQCTLNGVTYTGSVDTGFFHAYGTVPFTDTNVVFSGTSFDKKANISFRFQLNRTGWRTDTVIGYNNISSFLFDTSAIQTVNLTYASAKMIFRLDSVAPDKIKGRFDGTVYNSNVSTPQKVTNGFFSFRFFSGSNEPKKFLLETDNGVFAGRVKYARVQSNTLILDGFNYAGDSTFKLMVRTGSSIKKGRYTSRAGNVAFEIFRPSIYPITVTDTLGNLIVDITSVDGNIIEGNFSGISRESFSYGERPVNNGKFRCRVKNYLPQQDSLNKWWFVDENGLNRYSMYGGNILNATKSQVGIKYIIRINGESDNGASAFVINLSAYSPITTGIYEGGGFPATLDSLSFKSPYTYTMQNRNGMYVVIDSINNQRVVGQFYQRDFSGGAHTIQGIRKGSFHADLR